MMIKKILLILFLLIPLKSALSNDNGLPISQISEENFADIATLQGLNKITAKVSNLQISVGNSQDFGKLTILVHKCHKAPPEERPENKILIEVFENNAMDKKQIFYGWMLSSTPSISSLEHPIYDITAINCQYHQQQ